MTKNELLVLEDKWKGNVHPVHGKNHQVNRDHNISDYTHAASTNRGNVDDHIHNFYDAPERNEQSFDQLMDE